MLATSPAEKAYEQMRYAPQGGAICPLFKASSPGYRPWTFFVSNIKAAGRFYIGFVIFKRELLIYQSRRTRKFERMTLVLF